jgi:hypothetical protein
MKKIVLVCLAVLFAAGLASEALASGVGFKAGFSLARIRETSTLPIPFTWKGLPFVTGGLTFESGLGPVTLQPEILYVQMGGKYDVDPANGLRNRFHYIQVPVQLRVDLAAMGPVRPFVAAGVYGAYLVRAEASIKVNNVITKANVTPDYNRSDWGAVGSAGLTFKVPGMVISVEGRYNLGLTNILRSPIAGDSIKNRCWMALVGLHY